MRKKAGFQEELHEKMNSSLFDRTIEVVRTKSTYVSYQTYFLMESRDNNLLLLCESSTRQDGRLAPAYFSPNYKYFDQLLQTVKNKTTVLILVFKEFLQTSIRPLISVIYAKGYHDFPTVPKNFVGEPFCVSENFWYRKMLGIREGAGITIFCQNCFVSQYRKTS